MFFTQGGNRTRPILKPNFCLCYPGKGQQAKPCAPGPDKSTSEAGTLKQRSFWFRFRGLGVSALTLAQGCQGYTQSTVSPLVQPCRCMQSCNTKDTKISGIKSLKSFKHCSIAWPAGHIAHCFKRKSSLYILQCQTSFYRSRVGQAPPTNDTRSSQRAAPESHRRL